MRALRRVLWTPVHVVVGLAAFTRDLLRARGGTLVFTHFQDRDATGRDQQMGPFLEALAARGDRLVQVELVPLSGSVLRARRPDGRLAIPHALLLLAARLLALGGRSRHRLRAARRRVAAWALRALAVRIVYTIDESGSGQPFVQAGRSLGIPVVGVQHGDFRPGNPRYDAAAPGSEEVAPVDALCLWSPWFKRRLMAISRIYGEHNTRVTGRPGHERPVPATPEPAGEGRVNVLVLEDAGEEGGAGLAPFVEALRGDGRFALRIRGHPGSARAGPRPPLQEELQWCRVAVGRRSSALLMAIRAGRPVVVLDPGADAELAREGLAEPAADPGALVAACLELSGSAGAGRARSTWDRVWGDVPPGPPTDRILEVGDALLAARTRASGFTAGRPS